MRANAPFGKPFLAPAASAASKAACCVLRRDHCIAMRSLVCPNDGFWRVLCALEGPLGILNK
jgi:hypothetical protein